MALACPVQSGLAPAKMLMMAIARRNETAAKSVHFNAFRHARSRVRPWASRRRRCARSPSIQSSMGRIQLSRKTVCGQAYPHQIRPKTAVKKKREKARKKRSSARKIVSDGVKIAPNRKTLRPGRSICSSGWPRMVIHGTANRSTCSRRNATRRSLMKKPSIDCG